jgi:hypothetical protein
MPYFTPDLSSPDMPGRQGSAMPTPIVFERVPPERTPWEYSVVTLDPREEEPLTEARLAELGKEGWLLVSILPHPSVHAVSRLSYYFVRPAA